MAQIMVQVVLDTKGLPAQIKAAEAQLSALGKGVQIRIDAPDVSKLQGLSRQLLTVANNQARAQIASSNAAAAASRLSAAQERTAQATAKASTEASKQAAAQERTTQSANLLATAQERTAQATAKANAEASKQAAAQERTTQSANLLAAEQERTARSASDLALAQEGTAQTANRLAAAQERTAQTVNQLEAAHVRGAQSAAQQQAAIDRLGATVGNLGQGSGIQAVRNLVTSMDGMAGATIKANGVVDAGGETWQRYTAQVGAAGGATQTYTYSVNMATGEVRQLDTGLKSMNESLVDNIVKFAKWMLIGNAISAVKRNFTQALDEMKKVDSELVVVRKVTGASADELDALSQRAYKVGSAYGVAASDFLSAVSDFSRAGYKELAADLGELAVKTQLVGDMSQENAVQMLLSVDAAYKYGGSIEQLSAVLDGMNEIDNNFATSMEKIAEGLGKVAPIASMVNVSIGELSAAIGTITAVTQRSGTEAATALRAIFLNIIGDTKTTFEDVNGELASWTIDEIKGMDELIQKYAKDELDAAKAAGDVLNPIKVIKAFNDAFKAGDLTRADLMSMLSDVGGKLRTTQLVALVEHFDDMFAPMLETFSKATGSADKEYKAMMDSWNVKTQQLSNTWTEFIQKTINADWIKAFLDGSVWVLKFLDNLGNAAVLLGGLVLTFKGVQIAESATRWINGFRVSLIGLRGGLSGAISWIGLLTTAISLGISAWNSYRKAQEEAAQNRLTDAEKQISEVSNAASKLVELDKLIATYEGLEEGSEGYAEASKALATALGLEGDAADGLKGKYKELAEEERKAYQEKLTRAVAAAKGAVLGMDMGSMDIDRPLNLPFARGRVAEWFKLKADLGSVAQTDIWTGALKPAADSVEGKLAFYERLVELKNIVLDADDSGRAQQTDYYKMISESIKYMEPFVAMLENAKKAQDEFNESFNGAPEAAPSVPAEAVTEKKTERVDEYADAIWGARDKLELLAEAQKQMRENGEVSDDLFVQLTKTFGEFGEEAKGTMTGVMITADALEKLTDAQKKTLEAWGLIDEVAEKRPLKDLANDALTLQDDLAAANAELQRLKDQLKEPEKGDAFGEYADNFKKLQELAKKKQFGSREFQGIIDTMAPTEMLAQFGYDYEKVYNEIAKNPLYKAMFAKGGEDFGTNFLQYMAKNMSEVTDENGNVIASFEKVGDTVNWVIEDVDALAKALNIDPEILMSWVDALGIFDGKVVRDVSDLKKVLDDMGDSVSTVADGVRMVDLNAYANALKNAGMDGEQIGKMIEALRTAAKDEKNKIKIGAEISDEDLTAIQTATDAAAEDTPTVTFDADTAPFDAGASAVEARRDAMDGTSATVTINEVTKKKTVADDEDVYLFGGYAGGTRDAQEGPALVNDGKGAGKQAELIVQDGKAFIANDGKPAIVNLSRGATVYTADETRDILRSGRAKGINAFGGGRYTGSTATGGDDTKKPSKSSSANKNKKTSDKDAPTAEDYWGIVEAYVNYGLKKAQYDIDAQQYEIEKLEKARDALLKPLDAEIKALREAKDLQDEQLTLAEKQKAVEEARAALQNAQNERTIRYFNQQTGQWEWRADENATKSAQDTLADAEKALADFLETMRITALERQKEAITQEYAALTEPYAARVEELQAEYDAFKREWETIQLAVSEPAGSISTALKKLASSGIPMFAESVGSVRSLLKSLAESLGMGKLTTGYGHASGFDEGGIASGAGLMVKGVHGAETVLGADITRKILSPTSSAGFERLTSGLGILYGIADKTAAQPMTRDIGGTSDSHDSVTYINGVQIGTDMMQRPLSDTLRLLGIYSAGIN